MGRLLAETAGHVLGDDGTPSGPVQIGTPGLHHGYAQIGAWLTFVVMLAGVLVIGVVVLLYAVRERRKVLARRRSRRAAMALMAAPTALAEAPAAPAAAPATAAAAPAAASPLPALTLTPAPKPTPVASVAWQAGRAAGAEAAASLGAPSARAGRTRTNA